ncbi:MAG: hypothetical protein SGJ05_11545 [bacterium]|nr:hypothetical protein [bacterium]
MRHIFAKSTLTVKRILFVITFIIGTLHIACAATEPDLMLLDNTEKIVQYGLDSTGSWWAITQPYEQFVHVYINGKRYGPYSSSTLPRFSNDGSTWAFAFVRDLQAYVRTPEDEKRIAAERINGVVFGSQSPIPWVEFSVSDIRTITDGSTTYSTTGAIGLAKLDPSGTVVWHVARRGSQMALVRNGVDKYVYDDIELAGVWSDARPVFSARIGALWTVFLGEQELVGNMQRVLNLTVNAFGTVVAFNASSPSSFINSYMYTDDYRNCWVGPNLDEARDLVLSPCCDLIAVPGKAQGGSRVVLFNSAAYPAGTATSRPAFSFDGAHMAFTGNDGESFISMDGLRHAVRGGVALSAQCALSPSGSTVAWTSSTTLVVYDLDREKMTLNKMCDTMSLDVIYNRRTSEYQALGLYGARLFLLSSPAR